MKNLQQFDLDQGSIKLIKLSFPLNIICRFKIHCKNKFP
jgi:hypothetical protein